MAEIIIEVDGKRVECADEKDARKALAKAAKESRANQKQRNADYEVATLKAQSKAFSVLSRVVRGETMPGAWRFYQPHDEFASSLFKADPEDRYQTLFQTDDGWTSVDLHGRQLLGVVCGGAGYVLCYFVRDRPDDSEAMCFALGTHNGQYLGVVVPGVTVETFHPAKS